MSRRASGSIGRVWRVLASTGLAIGAPWLVLGSAGCAGNPAPVAPAALKFSDFPKPDVPASLRVSQDLRDRHEQAWARLQAGDLNGAARDFAALVKRSPAFYPAEAGLGFTSLAAKQYKQAAAEFSTALAVNGRYLPALQGQAEADLGLHDDQGAIEALAAMLKIDSSRDAIRSRLDMLRLRGVQAQIEASRRARDAGRLDEAQSVLEHALEIAPAGAVILRELAIVETARGALDAAETHARRSVQLDAGDAEAQAALGAVLEAKDRYADAADAFTRAVAIDPRPAWRDKAESLRSKALAAAIPAEYRAIPTAATVTRAQVAAIIGLRLGPVLDRAPKRTTVVVTDVRGHWAEPWIIPVTQAGVMEALPNHTFEPGTLVRRSDLAHIVSQLLTLASARRPEDLSRWRSARPRFADLAAGHLSYPAAAIAVASGAMAALDGDRFAPGRAASGAELVAAIARIEQIAER